MSFVNELNTLISQLRRSKPKKALALINKKKRMIVRIEKKYKNRLLSNKLYMILKDNILKEKYVETTLLDSND